MRIIGIDPGMAIVGYCVMDISPDSNDIEHCIVGSGSIQTSKKEDNSTRLLEIHHDLTELIQTYKPDVAAIEQIFYFKNAKTIVPVCEARGVIVMTCKMHNIPISEYTPLVIKQTITGYGRATKDEVKDMVQIILGHESIPKLDDTCDAIAIALCHSRQID
jgi:crossover junction endodeoxyribonuclease RuvC